MEFKLGRLLKQPVHKSTYKMRVEFDDGEDIKFYTTDLKLLELLITTYDKYEKNLRDNWNGYCNPENVQSYFKDAAEELKSEVEVHEDFSWDYWSGSNEYECQARFDSWKITYYDENGTEFSVSVTK